MLDLIETFFFKKLKSISYLHIENLIAVTSFDGKVFFFSASPFRLLATITLGSSPIRTSIFYKSSILYLIVGTDNGEVYLISTRDFSIAFRLKLCQDFIRKITTSNSLIFVGNDIGEVYTLKIVKPSSAPLSTTLAHELKILQTIKVSDTYIMDLLPFKSYLICGTLSGELIFLNILNHKLIKSNRFNPGLSSINALKLLPLSRDQVSRAKEGGIFINLALLGDSGNLSLASFSASNNDENAEEDVLETFNIEKTSELLQALQTRVSQDDSFEESLLPGGGESMLLKELFWEHASDINLDFGEALEERRGFVSLLESKTMKVEGNSDLTGGIVLNKCFGEELGSNLLMFTKGPKIFTIKLNYLNSCRNSFNNDFRGEEESQILQYNKVSSSSSRKSTSFNLFNNVLLEEARPFKGLDETVWMASSFENSLLLATDLGIRKYGLSKDYNNFIFKLYDENLSSDKGNSSCLNKGFLCFTEDSQMFLSKFSMISADLLKGEGYKNALNEKNEKLCITTSNNPSFFQSISAFKNCASTLSHDLNNNNLKTSFLTQKIIKVSMSKNGSFFLLNTSSESFVLESISLKEVFKAPTSRTVFLGNELVTFKATGKPLIDDALALHKDFQETSILRLNENASNGNVSDARAVLDCIKVETLFGGDYLGMVFELKGKKYFEVLERDTLDTLIRIPGAIQNFYTFSHYFSVDLAALKNSKENLQGLKGDFKDFLILEASKNTYVLKVDPLAKERAKNDKVFEKVFETHTETRLFVEGRGIGAFYDKELFRINILKGKVRRVIRAFYDLDKELVFVVGENRNKDVQLIVETVSVSDMIRLSEFCILKETKKEYLEEKEGEIGLEDGQIDFGGLLKQMCLDQDEIKVLEQLSKL